MRIAFTATETNVTVTGKDGVKVYTVDPSAEYTINVSGWSSAAATPEASGSETPEA